MRTCTCGRPCWACAHADQALAWRLDVGGTFLAGAMAAFAMVASQSMNLHLCSSHRDMFDQLAPAFKLQGLQIADESAPSNAGIPKEWN